MKRTPKKRMDYTDWSEEDHIEHLRTHKPYQDFFANFKSESIEAFITKYGHEKYDMFQKREQYRENYEEYETQFLTGAEMYIDMILQKKLLNLQCQWRADLFELPLVDICQDFQHWERHIRACPFIPPVTADELELCIRFLKEEYDFTTENYIQDNDCQDYIAFKNQIVREEFEDSNEAGETAVQLPREERCYPLPELYEFFDTYQNTAGLLRLPDVRGPKDDGYLKEGSRREREIKEAELKAKGEWKEPVPYHYTPSVPDLHFYSDDLDKFVQETEDEDAKEVFKYYQYVYSRRTLENHYDEDEMDEYISFLRAFDVEIPIEAHENWEDAIVLAAMRFKQSKIIEMLLYAYDSYLLEFDEEASVEKIIADRVARYRPNYEDLEGTLYGFLLDHKKTILDVREALDGVRDFNY